ncbi:hypothetical protein DFH94DRAFT_679922 [Russula ochroleuca]|uniref:Ribonuclease H1 N-terminal domain-containing protein n=1 Tax=Russula ochroleuca TaxID=152965 RepID=A0A9P5N0S1_9AGAM|nr:hypothetical protein DFH94DRAFT_679922 [Russula ochroleuca]
MNSPEDELDVAPWQKTYEKQQQLLIKHWVWEQLAEKDTGDDLGNPTADIFSDANQNFRGGVLPGLHPASPRVAAVVTVMKSIVDPIPVHTDYNDHELIDAMTSLIVLPPPSTPPFFSLFTTSTMPQKFYIVFVGKCTGIFDDWPLVSSITSGVSGNCHKSYRTYNEAVNAYRDLKARGLVRVVRNPGDDAIFGPTESLMG